MKVIAVAVMLFASVALAGGPYKTYSKSAGDGWLRSGSAAKVRFDDGTQNMWWWGKYPYTCSGSPQGGMLQSYTDNTKCLKHTGLSNGTVTTGACDASSSVRWDYVISFEGGISYYVFRPHQAMGVCLAAPGHGPTDAVDLITTNCSLGNSQKWRLYDPTARANSSGANPWCP